MRRPLALAALAALALVLALALGPRPGAAFDDPIYFPSDERDASWRRRGSDFGHNSGYGHHHSHHHGHGDSFGPNFGPPDFDPDYSPDFDPEFAPNFRPRPGARRPAPALSPTLARQELPPTRHPGPGRVGRPYGPGAGASASASASSSASASASGGSRASASASASASSSASSNARCGVTIELIRILGGDVAELGQFPWQAALFYTSGNGEPDTVRCGGALVHERYVVTAAHCLHPTIIKQYRLTKVRLGEWDTSSARDCVLTRCAAEPLDFAVERPLLHPAYVARELPRRGGRHNAADIALLRLDRPAPYTEYIRPLCLPNPEPAGRPGGDDLQGERLIVAGWGVTENDTSSERLRFVQLPARSRAECARSLNIDVQATQLCVGGELGKDSCMGDSGGPLVATRSDAQGNNVYQLMGVVSFGGACGQEKPAVYTRVAAFLPWLRENMRP